MNFAKLDLNLLRVFDAMMIERNTTRAGARVGLSQPAVSSALNRLRHLLKDPLFIREGNLMVPTACADGLRQPVQEALRSLEQALRSVGDFDPRTESRAFSIHASDYFSEILLPELMEKLDRAAPGFRVRLDHADDEQAVHLLTTRQFDFAINDDIDHPAWLRRAPALAVSFVAIASVRHRESRLLPFRPGATLPADLFAALPHVRYTSCNKMHGAIDVYLQTLGLAREVRASAKEFYGAARVVAQTGLLGIAPRPFAAALSERLDLVSYELPLAMPPVPLYLYWHAAQDLDPGHIWFRGQLLDILSAFDERKAVSAPSAVPDAAGLATLAAHRKAG